MRRRSLTLLEVLIALGMISLLLSVTFPYLKQTLYFRKQFEVERNRIFSKAYVQSRLGTLLARIEPEETFGTVRLAGGSIGVVFEFNNQKDFDKTFYGRVVALLFFDRGRLLLEIKGTGNKTRKEVLMEGLSNIKWVFSYVTERNRIETTSEWNRKELPLFLLLEMKLSNERKETLYFRLKSSQRLGYPL